MSAAIFGDAQVWHDIRDGTVEVVRASLEKSGCAGEAEGFVALLDEVVAEAFDATAPRRRWLYNTEAAMGRLERRFSAAC